MRYFSPIVQQLLNNDEVSGYALVTIQFPTGTIKHTTLPYDVTISGMGTYVSDNNLMSIDAPKLSNIVDRESYKIIYSDNEREFVQFLQNNAVGVPVSIHIGFINTSDFVLDGALPGQPILDPDDLVLAYKGIIDTYSMNVDSDTAIAVTLECSSPMADLDLKRAFESTDDMMKSINPIDTSFDQIHIGSSAVSLLWGKKGDNPTGVNNTTAVINLMRKVVGLIRLGG